jgi:hypothetical protein
MMPDVMTAVETRESRHPLRDFPESAAQILC